MSIEVSGFLKIRMLVSSYLSNILPYFCLCYLGVEYKNNTAKNFKF